MTRGQISAKFNKSPETLRYYESIGLITPERDRNSGYRIYDENEILRLDLITRFKRFGFTLNEIKEFFDYVQKGAEDKNLLNHFLVGKIDFINEQIEGLNSVKESLKNFMTKEDVESCNILSKLLEKT